MHIYTSGHNHSKCTCVKLAFVLKQDFARAESEEPGCDAGGFVPERDSDATHPGGTHDRPADQGPAHVKVYTAPVQGTDTQLKKFDPE